MLDFSSIPMYENHTHGLDVKAQYTPMEIWPFYLHGIKEGVPYRDVTAEDMVLSNSVNLGLTRSVICMISQYLNCEATPEAVLEARNKLVSKIGPREYSARLYRDANIMGTTVDMPWPLGDEREKEFGCPAYRLFRIEPLFDELLNTSAFYGEMCERFEAVVNKAIDTGYIGFKAHPGERYSFALRHVNAEEAEAAFAERSTFEGEKTVYYALLARLLKICEQRNSIVHVHTGNSGSPLLNQYLDRCNPMLMIPFLNDPEYRCVPIALLHGDYPSIRVAAEMSHMYPNVYIDLSWTLPWVGLEFKQILRSVLAIAPHSKILLGSGQNHIPEFSWVAARIARKSLEDVMNEYVKDGMLTTEQARESAEMLLSGNAKRLYGLK